MASNQYFQSPQQCGKKKHVCRFLACIALVVSVIGYVDSSNARSLNLPSDPRQSIRYWKPFEVSEIEDTRVLYARQIFGRLLKAWDQTRVAPELFVVRSESGPFAASLEDGSILLSTSALDIAFSNEDKKDHYLAFILAHELAHQRNEHLWHVGFFRLAAQVGNNDQEKMLEGLSDTLMDASDIEQKEIQADQDALVYMALIGFSPLVIVEDKDFFTLWTESIWQSSCHGSEDNIDLKNTCQKASIRMLRAKSRIKQLATQTLLFELGNQYFIAGLYSMAHRYFMAFGREFPGHSVQTNIGLSQLAQAIEIKNQLLNMGKIKGVKPSYPIMLGISPHVFHGVSRDLQNKDTSKLEFLRQKLESLSSAASISFEKAIQIDPDNRYYHVNQICSYLVSDNLAMATGLLKGKYERKFGKDNFSILLDGLIAAASGDIPNAKEYMSKLINQLSNDTLHEPIEKLLFYSAYENMISMARYEDDQVNLREIHKKFAEQSQKSEDPALFHLALTKLGAIPNIKALQESDQKYKKMVGNAFHINESSSSAIDDNLLINGEKLSLHRLINGEEIIIDEKNIVVAQMIKGVSSDFSASLQTGSRLNKLIKEFGTPSRRVFTSRGEYFAYDELGLAFELLEGKINGWFFYPLKGED